MTLCDSKRRPRTVGGLLAGLCGAALGADEPKLKLSMEVGIEARGFVHDGAYPGQDGSGLSLSMEPEIDLAVPHGNVRFVPFYRWDQRDDARSHTDLRELALHQRRGDFDLLVGISRVFWGTTEAVHLVDIINQTDLVENLDGEEKLGQPLASLAWTTRVGVFSAFALPYFRERLLPGVNGRLRPPIPYDRSHAVYESGREEHHLDAALRWSLARGRLDLGLSHFAGTSREPRFEPALRGTRTLLRPVYDLIAQTGLDASWVQGGWVWKLEAIHQHNRIEDFTATATGFEYTFASVGGSTWDLGALSELLWDSRGANAPTAFQRDLFVGARLAANDVAGTELLAGMTVDLARDGLFVNLEASRRVGSAGKLTLELRLFGHSASADPLALLAQDDYLQLEYVLYF